MELKVALLGCGRVGRKFLELVQKKRVYLSRRYDLELKIVAAADYYGAAIDPEGLEIEKILETPLNEIRRYLGRGIDGIRGSEIIKLSGANLVLEAGPTDIKTGEPGLTHARTALKLGMHFVTLSKGLVVCAYPELRELARQGNAQFRFSGATAAALPTTDVALYSLAGAEIVKIQGILNGTTNFILSQMFQGTGYEEALRTAQENGIAEPDPSLDVKGWDTAAKILILANVVMDADLGMEDVGVEGITEINPGVINEAKRGGQTIKLIGEAVKKADKIHVTVGPRLLDNHHPLASVNDTVKGVHFVTDTMGDLTVIGGASDPKAAAAAALKDIITIVKLKGSLI